MESQEQKGWEQEKKHIYHGFGGNGDSNDNRGKSGFEPKKKSFLAEMLATISVSATALYSVFSDSYIGWVVVGLVVLLYIIYKLNKKKIGEGGESTFGFIKSKFRKNALRGQMSKNKMKMARGKDDKMMQKLNALKKQKWVKFKDKVKGLDGLSLKKGKGRGLEKNIKKDGLNLNREIKKGIKGELKKSPQMIGGQDVKIQGKNQRLKDLDNKAIKIQDLKQELGKKVSEKLVKEKGLDKNKADKVANTLLAGLTLENLFEKVAMKALGITSGLVSKIAGEIIEKAGDMIEGTGNAVAQGTKKVFDNITSDEKGVEKINKVQLDRKTETKNLDGRAVQQSQERKRVAPDRTFVGQERNRSANSNLTPPAPNITIPRSRSGGRGSR